MEQASSCGQRRADYGRRVWDLQSEEKLTKSRVPAVSKPPGPLPGLPPGLRNGAFKDAPGAGAGARRRSRSPAPWYRSVVSQGPGAGGASGRTTQWAGTCAAWVPKATTQRPSAPERSTLCAPTTVSSGDARGTKPQGPGDPWVEASSSPPAAACLPLPAPGVVRQTPNPLPAESCAAWWGVGPCG